MDFNCRYRYCIRGVVLFKSVRNFTLTPDGKIPRGPVHRPSGHVQSLHHTGPVVISKWAVLPITVPGYLPATINIPFGNNFLFFCIFIVTVLARGFRGTSPFSFTITFKLILPANATHSHPAHNKVARNTAYLHYISITPCREKCQGC